MTSDVFDIADCLDVEPCDCGETTVVVTYDRIARTTYEATVSCARDGRVLATTTEEDDRD